MIMMHVTWMNERMIGSLSFFSLSYLVLFWFIYLNLINEQSDGEYISHSYLPMYI